MSELSIAQRVQAAATLLAPTAHELLMADKPNKAEWQKAFRLAVETSVGVVAMLEREAIKQAAPLEPVPPGEPDPRD